MSSSGLTDSRCLHSSEQGAVLVLSVFAIAVLLALGAVAVDVGNLYFAQLRLQKAADAAVFGGIGYTIERGNQGLLDDANSAGYDGTTEEGVRKLVQLRADELLSENLRAMDIELPQPCSSSKNAIGEHGYCSHYDIDTRILSVTPRADIDFLLIDAVPFQLFNVARAGSAAEVAAHAETQRPAANIALVLDVSGSMACPADPGTPCDCRAPGSTVPCQGELKVDKLIDGMLEFVKYFDTKLDRFTLVPFNMRAKRIKGGFESIAWNLIQRDHLQCVLQGFNIDECGVGIPAQPASNTNVCDAFIQAFQDVEERGLVGKEEIAYLYFSDGAPTAGRFFFNKHDNLPVNDPYDFGGNTKDYVHYAVQWTDEQGKNALQGPSLLVKTQSMEFHWNQPLPPYPDFANPGLHVPVCHEHKDKSGAVSELLAPSSSDEFCNVFNGCLGPKAGPASLQFELPWVGEGYGADVKCANANKASRETDWLRQYYHCAITMADYMRSQRGTFYVIGLGPEAATSADPYQDVRSSFFRKDYFLARVANDFVYAVQLPEFLGEDPLPEFAYDGSESYEDLSSKGVPRFGEYLATPNPADLRKLFRRMAKRISFRLIK